MKVYLLTFLLSLQFFCVFGEGTNSIVIKSPKDLGGKEYSLPKGATLIFKKSGCLKNGTVIGEDIRVIASEKRQIFSGIVLNGSFTAKTAYSKWFGLVGDCVIDEEKKYVSGTNNGLAFRNMLLFDNISIAPGQYMVKSILYCRSNQVINGNGSTIKFLNNCPCLQIGKEGTELVENVTIKNLHIIGSKADNETKTEYWHGVFVEHSKNVEIDNVFSEYCRGDGFYIGTRLGKNSRVPQNIVIKNSKAYYNHRQGLSITRAISVTVDNCEFCYTSGTRPAAGLDIEPNYKELENGELIVAECDDITISGCKFKGNCNEGLLLANHISYKPEIRNVKNLRVVDCDFYDDDISITGCVDSKFDSVRMVDSRVVMTGRAIIRNLTLSNFELENTKPQDTNNAITIEYNEHWHLRNDIILDKISAKGYNGAGIKIEKGLPLRAKKFDGVTIKNCTITDCTYGIETGNSVLNLHEENNTVELKKKD